MSKGTVVVTGVSGYIALWVAKQFSENGWKVRGTVRSTSSPSRVEMVKKAVPDIVLFEADLVKEGSFDSAISGADLVAHVASPFIMNNITDPQKQLVEPALQGTLNVLRSVEKSPSVKKVVLTSSVASVINFSKVKTERFNHESWNVENSLEFIPYMYSKTLAEKAAHEFCAGKNFKLAVINPAFVLGPSLNVRDDGYSVDFMKRFFSTAGDSFDLPMIFAVVDVRDIAEAHVRAAEQPDALGRFIISGHENIGPAEMAEILNANGFEKYHLPTKNTATDPIVLRFDTTRSIQELGMTYTPLDKTLVDMANSLIEGGLIKKID